MFKWIRNPIIKANTVNDMLRITNITFTFLPIGFGWAGPLRGKVHNTKWKLH